MPEGNVIKVEPVSVTFPALAKMPARFSLRGH